MNKVLTSICLAVFMLLSSVSGARSALAIDCSLLEAEWWISANSLKTGEQVTLRPEYGEAIEAVFIGATAERFFFVAERQKDLMGVNEQIFWLETGQLKNPVKVDRLLEMDRQKGGSCQSFAAANCLGASAARNGTPGEFKDMRRFFAEMTFEVIFGVKLKDYEAGKVDIDRSLPQREKILAILENRLGAPQQINLTESVHVDQLVEQVRRGGVAYLGAKLEVDVIKIQNPMSGLSESYFVKELTPVAKERHAVAVVDVIKLANGKEKLLVLDSDGGDLGLARGGFSLWDVASLKESVARHRNEWTPENTATSYVYQGPPQ